MKLRGQRPIKYSETKAKREYREAHPVCEACGLSKSDETHHIVTVKTGGATEDWNLLALCAICHYSYHNRGWLTFCDIFPHLAGKITAARIRMGRKT